MSKIQYFQFNNNKIAYKFCKRRQKTIVFIHGLQSNMDGIKAKYFSKIAKKRNLSFLVFDLRGHGRSSGLFQSFSIKDWYDDLVNITNFLNIKDMILIGSSMGGWLAINYSLLNSSRVSKLLGIAAAPDFTELLLWNKFSKIIKNQIIKRGFYEKKISENFTYIYSKKLIENSRLMLTQKIKKKFSGEAIFFHGSNDKSVPYSYNNRFLNGSQFSNLTINIIKGGDHSLSNDESLKKIEKEI